MSIESDEDAVTLIPLSVVFITVGMIVLATAAAMWWISIATQTPVARLMETAVPLPTPVPQTPDPTQEPVALLPDSPVAENEYPPHYVSALEAARPYTGEPMHISIPQIEVDAPITAVSLQSIQLDGNTYLQWDVPANYIAGWHDTSARLGQGGNTVLNGHHNIYGEVFRDLVDLSAGDQIFVEDAAASYTFEVSDVLILEERDQPLTVREENAKWIGETEDERLTLVTCWPYSDNSHRVIVVAYPISKN